MPAKRVYETEEQRKEAQRESVRRYRARNVERRVEYDKQRREMNPDMFKRRKNRWWSRLRTEVLTKYGARCVCCGETEPAFLQIDHVNNDGYVGRRTGQTGSAPLYRKLRDEPVSADYQVLCVNCNFAKHTQGICPHQLFSITSLQ